MNRTTPCVGKLGHQCSSVQFSRSIVSTLCDPMNRSTPGLPVHHHLPEFTETHVHRVGDAIQPSHPLSSPFPPAPNPSLHQSLFQGVNSSHEVAKVLEWSVQFSSVAQSCLTLCNPMNCSNARPPRPSPTPGVHPNPRPSSQ